MHKLVWRLSEFAFFMRLLRWAHFLILGDCMRSKRKTKLNILKGYKVVVGERYDKKFYNDTRKMRLLEYIAEGEGKYIINGISVPFEKGDMIVMTGAGYPEIQADKIKRFFVAYNKKEIIEKDFEFLADICKKNDIHKKIADMEKSLYKIECEFVGNVYFEEL